MEGTSSVAAWMYKHPALRWVNTLGPTGELRESYMVERSRDPLSESRGMKVSPEANERHNVMDCELFLHRVENSPQLLGSLVDGRFVRGVFPMPLYFQPGNFQWNDELALVPILGRVRVCFDVAQDGAEPTRRYGST